jgi:GcrA cell cycle regulator
MGAKPTPWSDAKRATFLRLVEDGKGVREIADAMQLSPTSISKAGQRYGVTIAPTRPAHVHDEGVVTKVMVEMIAGKSASMVAAMIGKTRNVVIGIWHRNATVEQRALHASRQQRPTRRPVSTFNNPQRPGPARVAAARALQDGPRPAPRPSSPTPQPADTVHKSAVFDGVALVASVLELESHHCRWPAGSGFCGHSHRVGSPYCERHHARAHVQANASHTPNATARISDEARGIISI